jgi:hypothetical protein
MYGGRAKRNKYPAASVVAPPTYGTNLYKSIDARQVRSETELRQAISDIQQAPATITARSEFDSQDLRRSSAIEIAAPFVIGSTVTIPEECYGLEIYSAGFNPIGFADGVTVCFAIYAQYVRLRNITQYVPVGATPPAVFADLYGASRLVVSDCFAGGSTAGFRTPAGAGASDFLSFHNWFSGGSDLDLETSDSAFVGCSIDDVTIEGNRNRFVGNDLGDCSETGSSDENVFVGNHADDLTGITGANSVTTGNS